MPLSLANSIIEARQRALAFLHSMQCETPQGFGWRMGPHHDAVQQPGLLLHGTWCGVYLSVLLGDHVNWSVDFRKGVIATLQAGQQDEGYFQLGLWSEQEHFLHSWQYARFHATNYTLGALRLLDETPAKPLVFLEIFRDKSVLRNWLDARCMAHPGMEGNNIVNLASFFLEHARQGHCWAQTAFDELLEWHLKIQNLSTGYFDRLEHNTYFNIVHSVTGASHNTHLFWWTNRPLPMAERYIEDCLRIASHGSGRACTDIDITDLLVHLVATPTIVDQPLKHRIGTALALIAADLAKRQNSDGGFNDAIVGQFNLAGYRTPHIDSNLWATWFRMATLGMIAEALGLEETGLWRFRNTIGMGYRRANYLGGLAPLPFDEPDPKLLARWNQRRQRTVAPSFIRRTGRYIIRKLLPRI